MDNMKYQRQLSILKKIIEKDENMNETSKTTFLNVLAGDKAKTQGKKLKAVLLRVLSM